MIEKVAAVLQVDDLASAVTKWTLLLGVNPSFVDGDRWAQFDVGSGRIALAGTDIVGVPAVMLKVGDLDAARAHLAEAGLSPTIVTMGGHERRFTVENEGSVAIFYGR